MTLGYAIIQLPETICWTYEFFMKRLSIKNSPKSISVTKRIPNTSMIHKRGNNLPERNLSTSVSVRCHDGQGKNKNLDDIGAENLRKNWNIMAETMKELKEELHAVKCHIGLNANKDAFKS